MAIGATTVSMDDIRTEFGGSGAVSISDYYKGGSNIRSKAANNTAADGAPNVPTSGEVDFSNYRSSEKVFRKTYSGGAENQDASTVFGDDYAVDYPKEIKINSGVTLGATTTSEYALEIPSGSSGTITVVNDGTIVGRGGGGGAGGAAGSNNGGNGGNGSNGGAAMRIATGSVTVNNNGSIHGGGGGGAGGGGGGKGGTGGTGGTGGQGRTSSVFYKCGTTSGCPNAASDGNCYYYSGEGSNSVTRYRCTSYTYYNGGAGGAGGVGGTAGAGGAGGAGRGYYTTVAGTGGTGGSAGSASAGSAGAAGGTNAGAGGTGGTGGTGGAGGNGGDGGGYGSAGGAGTNGTAGGTASAGSTGGNGNYTNGSAGGAGGSGGTAGSAGSAGSAGAAVSFTQSYTMNNTGTISGAYN
jgi:hypothetical protein